MGYNLGRTAIHEIGHWLNPGHTFNDLADDGLRDKRCFDSDGVMDTPCQMKDSNGCMYNSHGCGLPHDVIPEALNNFMDYVYVPHILPHRFNLLQKRKSIDEK
jgi:hypothetical protein